MGKGEPNGNFFRVSHRVFESEKFQSLKPGAKILYITFCHLRNRFGDKNGIFYRTDKDLAIDSGLAIGSVWTAKKELAEMGFVRYKKGGRWNASYYQIVD